MHKRYADASLHAYADYDATAWLRRIIFRYAIAFRCCIASAADIYAISPHADITPLMLHDATLRRAATLAA